MSYLKLNDRAVIIESGGDTVLICDSFDYNQLIITGADSDPLLPADYFTNYFGFTQGVSSGYATGGWTGFAQSNAIDKFSFVADGNATDIGNLTIGRNGVVGNYSKTDGFTSGGYTGSAYSNVVDKFPFSSDDNASDAGDLFTAVSIASSSTSPTHGYVTGGTYVASFYILNRIQKFPFSSFTTAEDAADLTSYHSFAEGNESTTHGYRSGGRSGHPFSPPIYVYPQFDNMDKFPFAVDADATDVGDLIPGIKSEMAGQSSVNDGYLTTGAISDNLNQFPYTPAQRVITKFPFATDAPNAFVGNLYPTAAIAQATGQSSVTHGYVSGGRTVGGPPNYPAPAVNTIFKFPFVNDASGEDVGNLDTAAMQQAGIQA